MRKLIREVLIADVHTRRFLMSFSGKGNRLWRSLRAEFAAGSQLNSAYQGSCGFILRSHETSVPFWCIITDTFFFATIVFPPENLAFWNMAYDVLLFASSQRSRWNVEASRIKSFLMRLATSKDDCYHNVLASFGITSRSNIPIVQPFWWPCFCFIQAVRYG